MDAQELINEIGEFENNMYVEGDSDIIDEAAEELNNSMD